MMVTPLDQVEAQIELLSSVTRAAEWSIQAYKALFTAFTVRSKVKRALTEDPYTEFVQRISVLGLSPGPGQCFMERSIKFLKETTCYIAAKGLKQEQCGDVTEPLICEHDGHPMPGILAGGWIGLRCKRIMHGVSKSKAKRIALCLDVLFSKLGMAPAPEEYVRSALEKHRKVLTTEQDLGTGEGEELRERIHKAIKLVVRKIFGGVSFVPRDCFPSLNACYESGRAEGGTFGALLRRFVESRKIDFPTSQERQKGQDLDLLRKLGIDPHLSALSGMTYLPRKGVTETRTFEPHMTIFPSVEILDEFEEFVDHGLQEVLDHPELNLVEPCAILEPLKVRIITKGNPFLNLRTLELQKMMHGRLRTFSPFVAIGRPLTDQDFDDRFKKLDPLKKFCSGDYVASTDNLDPEISQTIWTEICKNVTVHLNKGDKLKSLLRLPQAPKEDSELLFTNYWEAGRLALTKHQLVYPLLDGRDSEVKYEQKWGQLMGSPMSFPILCIANYVASCVGLGWDPVEMLKDGSPILVNGDDIAFQCTAEEYQGWQKAVSSVGLRPSLGKNYWSDEFLTMNSECRIPSADAFGVVSWSLTSYINIALLWGYDKKGTNAGSSVLDDLSWWDVGSRARSLLRGVDHGYDRVLSEFSRVHEKILHTVPAGVSYYLPPSLGGVGLPLPKGEKAENLISISNLKFASYVSCLDSSKLKKILHRPQSTDSSIFVQLSNEIEEELAETCGGYQWIKTPTTYRWLVNEGLANSIFMSHILGSVVGENLLQTRVSHLKHLWSRQLWGKPGAEPKFALDAGLTFKISLDEADRQVKSAQAAFDHKKEAYNWFLLKHYRKALSSSLDPMRIDHALGYMKGYSYEAPWDSVSYPSSMRFHQPRLFRASDYSINKSEKQKYSYESWAQFRDRTKVSLLRSDSFTEAGFEFLGLN